MKQPARELVKAPTRSKKKRYSYRMLLSGYCDTICKCFWAKTMKMAAGTVSRKAGPGYELQVTAAAIRGPGQKAPPNLETIQAPPQHQETRYRPLRTLY